MGCFKYFFVALLSCHLILAALSSQPEIASSNGNLILRAPYNKNISLSLSGTGRLLVNDIDLRETARSAENVTRVLKSYISTYETVSSSVQKYGDLIEGTNGILNRLNQLENGNSSTGSPDNFSVIRRAIRFLQVKINRVQRRVTTIVRFLNQDECATNPCKNGATCQDLYKSFHCICPKEWEGETCEKDVNECAIFAGTDLGCQNGATCINKPGTYECMCPQGFYGTHCTRKNNDCVTSGTELCQHGICVNQQGGAGYKCICDQGWTTDSTNPSCSVDVNECTSNRPHCSVNPPVTCINLPGSFYCGSCPPGYSGNGFYCSDIDECAINNGGCSMSPKVQCMNTQGSRICGPCPPGYIGDGTTCTFQGICSVNNGGCHPHAQCTHNPAIGPTHVQCTCPSGYVGTGIGPQGCTYSFQADPCNPNPCKNGVCSPSGDGYICTCNRQFTGRNCDTQIDYCNPNPCKNGGTCRSNYAFAVYICDCPSTHKGQQCEEEREACGDRLTDLEGTLKYPTINTNIARKINCAWVIETNDSLVLNVTFNVFNFQETDECLSDFLQIHDGGNAAGTLVGRFCGDKKPKNGTIITSQNSIYIWMKTDNAIPSNFDLNWTSITPICGGEIDVTSHGTIDSPGTPGNYPPDRDCTWTLRAPLNKRILFHFFKLEIGTNSDCTRDYLEFTESGEVLARYCNSSTPQPLRSHGPIVTVHFHSDEKDTYPGFQVTYSLEAGIPGCGGVFTGSFGEISSPSLGEYPDMMLCEYELKLPAKTRVKLSFTKFSLENSDDCQYDYVAIYDGPTTTSPLVGKYCGAAIPSPDVVNSNELLIVFRSDESNSGEGFVLKYETICGGVYAETSGVIESPNISGHRLINCIYEIIQPLGTVIRVDFEHFRRYAYTYRCNNNNNFLEVHDGGNENATLIGTYCYRSPPRIISTYNILWMRFRSENPQRFFFRANYTTIETGCGGIVHVNSSLNHITSPASPESDTFCMWILMAQPGYFIRLDWLKFELEDSYNCVYDKVNLYENKTSTGPGVLIGTYCGKQKPPSFMSTNSVLTIVYETDSSVNLDGFLIAYNAVKEDSVCGGTFHSPSGTIKSPHYPNNYDSDSDCTWTIIAPSGRQIMLNITDFELEQSYGCTDDYLEIRQGSTTLAPLVGKYCDTSIPKQITSHANQLQIHFVSDYMIEAKGFRITWDSSTTGCGGVLTSYSGSITSPNYPSPYGSNAECFWKIHVNIGSVVTLYFVDMQMEENNNCMLDYVEVFDGWEQNSPSLGTFCTRPTDLIQSSSNKLLLKFRSDISVEERGFHIQYNTRCTNKLKGLSGTIESPNYPAEYPDNVKCNWQIETYIGNNITLAFSSFQLEEYCRDNITISYGVTDDFGTVNIKSQTLCSLQTGRILEFPSNAINITFATDSSLTYPGFHIEWQAKGCGGTTREPKGTITSPNYPNAYPNLIECVWTIQSVPGTAIEIIFNVVNLEREVTCSFDYIKVYNGPDATFPLLASICDRLRQPVNYTSAGSTVFIHFMSDISNSGKGFTLDYKTVESPSKCGGVLKYSTGTIHSPNYPKNYNKNESCEWLIEVAEHHRVELSFDDVDFPSEAECAGSYVKVFDGPTAAYPVLVHICNNTKPNGTIVSTGNQTFVEFVSSDYYTAKGFLANYVTSCGASFETSGKGIIELPKLPKYEDCSWTISASDPSNHLSLSISKLITTTRIYCDNITYAVRIYNGNDENAPILAEICTQSVPRMITGGSVLHIVVEAISVASFSATYSVYDSHCGGNIRAEKGEIATPKYPGTYPPEIKCEWVLDVAPGNAMILNFQDFDLAKSEKCDVDYLEIREFNGTGRVVALLCGDTIPQSVTINATVWMMFESSPIDKGDVPTSKGFLLDFSLATEVTLISQTGKIASPLYPDEVSTLTTYSWRINVPFGYQISISFPEFYVTSGYAICYYTYLKIFEGHNADAKEVASFCGVTPPEPVTIRNSIAYIVMNLPDPSQFLLEWKSIRPTRPTPTTKPTSECRTNEIIDLSNTTSYNLTSPGFLNNNYTRLDCEWMFSTKPGNHLILRVTQMLMARHFDVCQEDVLRIYVGTGNTANWKLAASLCKPDSELIRNISYTDFLKLEFVSRRMFAQQQAGFSALITNVCGGSMSEPTGIIEVPKDTNQHFRINCKWNVTVRSGRTIRITFESLEISQNVTTECLNYVSLKNGHLPDSPPIGPGKYCGNYTPSDLETSSNQLGVAFYGSPLTAGFRLRYQEVSIDCDTTINLENPDETYILYSPNYPDAPPPHIQCTWIIMAPAGESVRLDFLERFDLTKDEGCTKERVEVRDGGTDMAPLLGKFCGRKPSSQVSSDRMILVRFFSDVDRPKNGFKAKAVVATCGGTITDLNGEIKMPQSADLTMQTKKIDCVWHISVPLDYTITLRFLSFDLGVTSDVCTQNSYVNITETYEANINGTELGIFCGDTKPSLTLNTISNGAIVHFHSDGSLPNNFGFQLKFNSSRNFPCRYNLNTDSGTITSPKYPNIIIGSIFCSWMITVQKGRRIKFEFIDVDVDTSLSAYELSYQAFNDEHYSCPISRPSRPGEPKVFQSSSNTMKFIYRSTHTSFHRGFKAQYTSDEPTICLGDFDQPSGKLENPMNESIYGCNWIRSVELGQRRMEDANETMSLVITAKFNRSSIACHDYYYSSISLFREKNRLVEICSNTDKPIRLSYPDMSQLRVYAKQLIYLQMNFTLSYKVNPCGGYISVGDGYITTPGYRGTSPAQIDCAWLLEEKNEGTIQIKFVDMDLGPCESNYVTIYGGSTFQSPKIGTFCKDRDDYKREFISHSSQLLIEYHYEANSGGNGFNMTYSAVENGCGGIFHDNKKTIQTPNYPNNYPNNTECEWDVIAPAGYYVKLEFVGRMYLEDSTNCVNDFIEVFDWKNENWVSLGRKCGRETPNLIKSFTNKMRIRFKSNERINGQGFQAKWRTDCGGTFDASEGGLIVSPDYPSKYPPNIICTYTIVDNSEETINVIFDDFEIEKGLADCRYDNVTIGLYIFGIHREPSNTVYCSFAPAPIRAVRQVTITFKSDPYVGKRGFKFRYYKDSCNVNITKPTILRTRTDSLAIPGFYGFPNNMVQCRWNITAPVGKVVMLKILELKLLPIGNCNGERLEVYEGHNVTISKRLLSYCGAVNDYLPQLRSDSNEMAVLVYTKRGYQYLHHYSSTFVAAVDFMYGPSDGCGGSIRLTEWDSKTITPPAYSNLDCHWDIQTVKGSLITVKVEGLNLPSCNGSCTCSYVEIRDGAAQFTDLIKNISCNNDLRESYTTSGNSAFIRFYTEGASSTSSFLISVKRTVSICGDEIFNVTSNPQTLSSPGYPETYPSNIKCTWVLKVPRFKVGRIKFLTFDLPDGPVGNVCPGDKLEISDMKTSNVRNEGLGPNTTISGSRLMNYVRYFSPQISQFCGPAFKNYEYTFEYVQNVYIKFTSLSGNHGKGFQVEYQLTDCNRNYTTEHGFIQDRVSDQNCTVYITVPENRTISIYFVKFQVLSPTNNCSTGLAVYDGPTQNSKSLGKMCGVALPSPIFSTSNVVMLQLLTLSTRFAFYEISYTSTDKDRGCGGSFNNYVGRFTSPMYPESYRKDMTCEWEIRVPAGLKVALKFSVFDIAGDCTDNYLVVSTFNSDLPTVHKFCPNNFPSELQSNGRITVSYKSSVHNGGTGWSAAFQAYPSGEMVSWNF